MKTKQEIWSAIRGKLPSLRNKLRAAIDANHSEEMAKFDEIAKILADAIEMEGDGRCTVMLPNAYGHERCGKKFGHEGKCVYERGD